MPETWDGPKPAIRSRIVVVETLYHQPMDGSSPTSVDNRYGRMLETDEQPYTRLMKIDGIWRELDPGWLKAQVETGAVGMLLLRNEEKDKDAIVEVAFGTPPVVFSSLPPGESLRLPCVQNLDKFRVRTRASRPLKVTLHLLPR